MTIAARLKELMSEKGWSEAELGRRAHVPQPTVHRIANGETRQPRRDTVTSLARALGVAPEWLWSGHIPLGPDDGDILDEGELKQLQVQLKQREELDNSDLDDFDPRETELHIKLTDNNGHRRGYSIKPCFALERNHQDSESLQQMLLTALSDDLGEFLGALRRGNLVKITLEFEDPLSHAAKVDRIMKIRRG